MRQLQPPSTLPVFHAGCCFGTLALAFSLSFFAFPRHHPPYPLMARQVLDVSIAGLLQKCRRVFSFTSSPNFCPSPASAANRLTIPAGCSEVDPTSLGQEQPQQPRVLQRQRRSRQLGAFSGPPTQPHSRLATHNLGCDNSSHHFSCCTSNRNSQMPH